MDGKGALGQREVEPLGGCASFSGHATDVQK